MRTIQVAAKEAEGRRLSIEKESLLSKEDYINSFLDRLEGETLGRMLEYLSSELTDSATQPRARDMMEDTEDTRQQEQEHIFAEIVKVKTDTDHTVCHVNNVSGDSEHRG